jgi:KaiC/GvpD/RAD55 family RecA-like ATPase
MPDGYVLGRPLPGEPVPPGSSVLVSGGHGTGPRRVALSLLAAGVDTEEPALVVSADRSTRQLVREYAETVGHSPPPALFRVVNCSGTPSEEPAEVDRVTSPRDLTGIGIGLVAAGRDLDADRRARVGVLSLSTVLRYAGLDRTFSFAHVLGGRIAAADRLGVFAMDPTTHQVRDVNALATLFDRVVELRTREETREVRVVGGPRGATAWAPY